MGPEVRVGFRPVPQPATLTACGHTLLLLFYFEGSLSSEQYFLHICPCPYPLCPSPFPLPLSVCFSPALLMSPTCIKVIAARGPTLNTLNLPLSPSPPLEACTCSGSRRHPPVLSVSQASGLLLVSVQCLAGVSEAAWVEGSSCLIQRRIPCTRSDGWLCSEITNWEIKGMLHSRSGKIKCARTNHF